MPVKWWNLCARRSRTDGVQGVEFSISAPFDVRHLQHVDMGADGQYTITTMPLLFPTRGGHHSTSHAGSTYLKLIVRCAGKRIIFPVETH